MTEPLHSIQVAAERAGVSAHVIRAWEKRYRALNPHRTPSGRRLYSDEEVTRLGLLRHLSEAGHGISHIANLPREKLESLIASAPTALNFPAQNAVSEAELLTDALSAVRALDEQALDKVLERGELALGAQGVLRRLIAPLAREIGERWRGGEITAAHEHFATAVIRLALARATKPFAASSTAPVIVVATPTGQIHELGALLAAASASNLGWRVIYLGASLGAAEIAGAVRLREARAVALSIVYPEDDPSLAAELTRLRDLLPETAIVVGGRASFAYRDVLDRVRAQVAGDIAQLGQILDQLRRPD